MVFFIIFFTILLRFKASPAEISPLADASHPTSALNIPPIPPLAVTPPSCFSFASLDLSNSVVVSRLPPATI